MRYFLLILLAIVLFADCSKKPTATTSTENTLRNGKWQLSSATVSVKNPNGKDTTLNYLLFIPKCYLDDYLVFDSLNYGQRYTGTNTCNPSDPSYFTFSWKLSDNNTKMALYNGFNYIYGIVDTIQPYHFDTLSQPPSGALVLDTVLGALDTSVPPKLVIELDTVRTLFYSGVPAGAGSTGVTTGGYDISNADIVNLTSSSFTLHFQMISYYNDSTMWHGASFLIPLDPVLNLDTFSIIRPDTFNYSFTFTNF